MRFRTGRFFASLLALFGGAGAAAPVVLDSGSAQGGEKTEESALYFGAKAKAGEKIVWKLDSPVPAGWSRVTIQFARDKRPNRLLYQLVFASPSAPFLDTYFIALDGNLRFSFLLSSAHPIPEVRLVKSQNRDLVSLPVASIRIEPVEADDGKGAALLDLPVAGGAVRLPGEVKPGLYRANQGAASPSALRWTFAGGDSFETPAAGATSVFLDEPLSSLGVVTVDKREHLLLERLVSGAPPAFDIDPSQPLIRTFDPGREESADLVLEADGDVTLAFADFPFGKKVAIVNTWDDGQIQDRKLAGLLAEKGFPGTFFLNHDRVMTNHMAELESLGHEVGSHSWSHPSYWLSTPERCEAESVEMRRWLEAKLGHPVVSFAYPFNVGKAYDRNGDYVKRAFEKAGYWSARSTLPGARTVDTYDEPWSVPTDGHYRLGADAFVKAYEAALAKPGGVLYFWGHAWELDGVGPNVGWGDFTKMLDVLGGKPEAWYVTQGGLFTWRWLRMNVRWEKVPGRKNVWKLTRPWLHPWLDKVPVALKLDGVRSATFRGKEVVVKDGRADLLWQ